MKKLSLFLVFVLAVSAVISAPLLSFADTADYQKVEGTFTETSTAAVSYKFYDDVTNGFTVSGLASTGSPTPSMMVAFPQSIDVTSLGDVFAFSFDFRVALTEEGLAKADTIFPDGYTSDIAIRCNNNASVVNLMTFTSKTALGLCVQATSSATNAIGLTYNGGTLGYDADAGTMNGLKFGEWYHFSFVVDKTDSENVKAYLYINDKLTADLSGKTNAMAKIKTLLIDSTNISGLKYMGRGGDGSSTEYVKVSFKDFAAVRGDKGMFVNTALTKDSSNVKLSYEQYNVSNSSIGASVIVAAYKGDSMIGVSRVSTQNTLPFYSKNDFTVDFGTVDVSEATNYKAFFVDNLNNLTPYCNFSSLE